MDRYGDFVSLFHDLLYGVACAGLFSLVAGIPLKLSKL